MPKEENYRKYRWFFTSSGKLVIGGKSAEQNEIIVKEIIKSKQKGDYIVMHTSKPGSPFTFLLDSDVNEKDLEEQAIFTACFSQEWKKRRKTAEVDIFNSNQIFKKRGMKKGTFGVAGRILKRRVKMELWIDMQEGKIRAVPKPKEKILCIRPGKTAKEESALKIQKKLEKTGIKVKLHEIMQAIPAGGISICRNKKR